MRPPSEFYCLGPPTSREALVIISSGSVETNVCKHSQLGSVAEVDIPFQTLH